MNEVKIMEAIISIAESAPQLLSDSVWRAISPTEFSRHITQTTIELLNTCMTMGNQRDLDQ